MNTPICDFVKEYTEKDTVRLHMPGHKGKGSLQAGDITEIRGADVLYDANGIIAQSERNAAMLFGTQKTVYSTEGSSLCIRAMLYLTALYAREKGRAPLVAAARNAHKTFVTAAALTDVQVDWLYGDADTVLSCTVTPLALERYLQTHRPIAVYITSPDYLGNTADISGLAQVCKRYDTLLLVDNAHGAYLHFLPQSRHPMACGATMCCDSAHKTLPVLTGGAYLHIGKDAPALFTAHAQTAMSLFASTSPSYLILQSLDAANAYLADAFPKALADFVPLCTAYAHRLTARGYDLVGDEPLKWTVCPKSYGYTGTQLADLLADAGIVCEFADADYVTMMFSPLQTEAVLQKVCDALCALPPKPAITTLPPLPPHPQVKTSLRQALFSCAENKPLGECLGRVIACPTVSCPPAIPLAVCGEVVDEQVIKAAKYYGIEMFQIVK